MSDLHGFLPPLTPTGKSAIIPEMPWYYSGTLLTVEYLTDPANVRAILPPDIDLAPEEPGAVALIGLIGNPAVKVVLSYLIQFARSTWKLLQLCAVHMKALPTVAALPFG